MDDISILLSEGIDNYYNYLTKTGYMPETDVNQLLLLSFLQDFLTNYQQELLDSGDYYYTLINSIINCLYSNSCLLNWDRCEFNIVPVIEED